MITDFTGFAALCVSTMGTPQLDDARARVRDAEARQMDATTIAEFDADQAIIDKAQAEIDVLERKRA